MVGLDGGCAHHRLNMVAATRYDSPGGKPAEEQWWRCEDKFRLQSSRLARQRAGQACLLGKEVGRQAGRLGQEKRLVACDRLTDGQGLPAASTTNIFTWKLHNSLHSLHT